MADAAPPSATTPDHPAARLTSYILHKHYCENDVEAIIETFDDTLLWIGAAEHEYSADAQEVRDIFRQFAGKVIKCDITDEEYDVIEPAPGCYLCTGRLWIATSPETNTYLRVHQRISALYRVVDGTLQCCHIHNSNPYVEMDADDVGFPTKMAKQSYEYLQECVREQHKKLEEQTRELARLSFEDSLTGLHNRNAFNHAMRSGLLDNVRTLGVAYFDNNGLKETNDRFGHVAGDDLIRRTAGHIRRRFENLSYRIGGDEYVVIAADLSREEFEDGVARTLRDMEADGISIAAGCSWRDAECDIKAQFDEADRLMYQNKARHYSERAYDRRRR